MRFYNQQHQFYCGVDLHARTMYLCVLDAAGGWNAINFLGVEGTNRLHPLAASSTTKWREKPNQSVPVRSAPS